MSNRLCKRMCVLVGKATRVVGWRKEGGRVCQRSAARSDSQVSQRQVLRMQLAHPSWVQRERTPGRNKHLTISWLNIFFIIQQVIKKMFNAKPCTPPMTTSYQCIAGCDRPNRRQCTISKYTDLKRQYVICDHRCILDDWSLSEGEHAYHGPN